MHDRHKWANLTFARMQIMENIIAVIFLFTGIIREYHLGHFAYHTHSKLGLFCDYMEKVAENDGLWNALEKKRKKLMGAKKLIIYEISAFNTVFARQKLRRVLNQCKTKHQ